MKPTIFYRWGAKWYSKNRLDGVVERILFHEYKPAMFPTKKEAMEFIKEKYGYIATRKDLRVEPHGWRMPKPVKLKITLKII